MVLNALRKDISILAEDFGSKIAMNFVVSIPEAKSTFKSINLEYLLTALKAESEKIDSYLKCNLHMISGEIDKNNLFDETQNFQDDEDADNPFKNEVEVKQKVLEGTFFTKKQRLKHILYYSAIQTKQ